MKYLLTTALGMIALSVAAHAATFTPALTTTSPALNLGNPPFTLGWEFQVNTTSAVNGLGVLDSTGNGLAESHDVGLWDFSGNLIAMSTVDAGTVDALVSSFRFVSITPVTLTPGTYFIGALYTSGADAVVFPDGAAPTTVPAITYLTSEYAGGGTLTEPTNSGGQDGYFGPNLSLTAVPEPASVALFGLGLVGLAMRRRRAA